MKTVVKSPKRELEEFFMRKRGGILEGSFAGGSYRCGDWMRFHCGDRVYNKADPRHLGKVLKISWGYATVKWDDTGWFSEVFVRDLRKERP